VADTEGGCQLVDADDRSVAPALLKAADVLLAESRALRQLLLREAPVLPDTGIVVVTVLVAVAITDTVFEPAFAT
jgi:hypothetical protein